MKKSAFLITFLLLSAVQSFAQEDPKGLLWKADIYPYGSGLYRVMDFCPTKPLIALCNENIFIFDVKNGDLLKTITLENNIRWIEFSPDGRNLAGITLDGDLYIWDTDNWEKSLVYSIIPKKKWMYTSSIKYSNDGKILVIGGDLGIDMILLSTIDWSLITKFSDFPVTDPKYQIKAIPLYFSFSYDDKQIAIILAYNEVLIYDIQQQKAVQGINGIFAAFSKKKDLLYVLEDRYKDVTDTNDGIYKYENGIYYNNRQKVFRFGINSNVGSMYFTPDDNHFAYMSTLWNLNNSKQVYNWSNASAEFAPAADDELKYYAISTAKTLYLMDFDKVTKVEEKEFKDDLLKIYPNPAQDYINISLTKEFSGEAEISLVDIHGRIIKSIKTQDFNLQMDISGVPSGVYGVVASLGGRKIMRRVAVVN